MNDLHARALRAAEWLNDRLTDRKDYIKPINRGVLDSLGQEPLYQWYDELSSSKKTNRGLIAEAEDLGWIDTAEDEGTEVTGERCKIEDFLVEWELADDGNWDWRIMRESPRGFFGVGVAPTRAEARRAALEAARGLG